MKGFGIRAYLKYQMLYPLRAVGKQKIFCIGRNKTGTTSLAAEFQELGFPVGRQRTAEELIDFYIRGDFKPIIEYCKSAQVFQDVPFSWPVTYRHLDKAFPNSRFILTIRDDSEKWYNSLTKFHSKIFGQGNIPNSQQLKNARYVYKGFMWKVNRAIYGTPEDDPYNKQILIQHYEDYNEEVRDYFKGRNNLLTINLKQPEAYSRFCEFIGIDQKKNSFPWKNKTSEKPVKFNN